MKPFASDYKPELRMQMYKKFLLNPIISIADCPMKYTSFPCRVIYIIVSLFSYCFLGGLGLDLTNKANLFNSFKSFSSNFFREVILISKLLNSLICLVSCLLLTGKSSYCINADTNAISIIFYLSFTAFSLLRLLLFNCCLSNALLEFHVFRIVNLYQSLSK